MFGRIYTLSLYWSPLIHYELFPLFSCPLPFSELYVQFALVLACNEQCSHHMLQMQFVHHIVRNSTTPNNAIPTAIIGVLFQVYGLIINITIIVIIIIINKICYRTQTDQSSTLTMYPRGPIVLSGECGFHPGQVQIECTHLSTLDNNILRS